MVCNSSQSTLQVGDCIEEFLQTTTSRWVFPSGRRAVTTWTAYPRIITSPFAKRPTFLQKISWLPQEQEHHNSTPNLGNKKPDKNWENRETYHRNVASPALLYNSLQLLLNLKQDLTKLKEKKLEIANRSQWTSEASTQQPIRSNKFRGIAFTDYLHCSSKWLSTHQC